MPPTCAKYVLKVSFGHDTRRFPVGWASNATSTQAILAIQGAVRSGFAPRLDGCEINLMYRDEDEDSCTLVAATLVDCLGLCEGTLRLVVEQATPQFSVSTFVTDRLTSPRGFAIEDEYDTSWAVV